MSEKSCQVWKILLECCHVNCWRQNISLFRSSINDIIQTYKNITVALVCLFVLFLQSYEPSKTWKLLWATLNHLYAKRKQMRIITFKTEVKTAIQILLSSLINPIIVCILWVPLPFQLIKIFFLIVRFTALPSFAWHMPHMFLPTSSQVSAWR